MTVSINKSHLDYLEEISSNTRREHDFSILLTSNTNDFTTNIYPPFQFNNNWSVGMMNFSVYNNIQNINATNNLFRYSINGGVTWKLITLTPGSYEIDTINSEINRLMTLNGDSGITISANTITLGSIIDITPAAMQVDFTIANSLASVLGFNAVILTVGHNTSPNPVDIITINQILVNCDIINNSYLNSSPYPSIYSFPINVNTGERFTEQPNNIVYFPVNRSSVNSIRLWVTDQDGNAISLGGQNVVCRLHFKFL